LIVLFKSAAELNFLK